MKEIALASLLMTVSNLCGLAYAFYIGTIISYLGYQEQHSSYSTIAQHFVLLTVLAYFNALFRNHSYLVMLRCLYRVKKTFASAMFDKVSKLTLQSLTIANPGKLISIVSSDFDSVYKALGNLPMLASAPICNLIFYGVLVY